MRTLVVLALLVSAFPVDARAALTLTAPAFGNFADVALNGQPQTTTASVGNWSVDATGTLTGWHVDIAATRFTSAGGATLPLGSMTYRGPNVTGGSGQLPGLYPVTLVSRVAPVAIDLSASGATSVSVVNALPGTGSGVWNFSQGASDLSLSVPVGIVAGSYTSTITITLSAGPL